MCFCKLLNWTARDGGRFEESVLGDNLNGLSWKLNFQKKPG